MKLKSLLIGSAAAVITAPAALAADIIIPEPEVVEYVRVCDAAGEGFFYIPGTETCLSIGGFVRVQMDIEERFAAQAPGGAVVTSGDDLDALAIEEFEYAGGTLRQYAIETGTTQLDTFARWGWEWNTRGQVTIDSWTATDLGDLATSITFQGNSGAGGGDENVKLDEAFIELGGLHLGYSDNAFDGGIVGEADGLGGAKVNRVAYTFVANGFDATVSLDDDNIGDDDPQELPDFLPNLSGNAGYDFGMFDVRIFGAYDFGTDEGAIKGRLGVDVGADGRFELAAYYTSGETYVFDDTATFGAVAEVFADEEPAFITGVPLWAEWSVQGGYQHQVTSDLALTGNVGYWNNLGHLDDAASLGGDFDADIWNIGAVLDYDITETFALKASVTHWMPQGDADDVLDTKTTGFIRFQADF